jgi:hypothetical protein
MSRVSVLIVLLLGVGASSAQEDVPAGSFFADDSPLELTIEGPFRQLSRDGRERPERAGLVRYRDAQGQEVVIDVDIRIRGNSRLEFCSFPPLRLDFPRSRVGGTVFAGQNQLKLVTLCKQLDTYRDYLAQEYQIYRAFNALTDRSYRVRRAAVEYLETEGRRPKSFTEPAFLIEEDWEVAGRNDMQVLEVESLEVSDLDPRHTTLLAVFQFMIGNTDWSSIGAAEGENCCHNGKVIGSPAMGAFVIPYDFDQAGVINVPYAEPNPKFRIQSVRQRVYRGFCAMNGELEWVIQRLNEQRAAVEGAFDAERVSEKRRNSALVYMRDSYEIINDPELRNEEIVEACRGPVNLPG